MDSAAQPVSSGAIWKPNVGPQSRFLSCTAYEGLYGGAAGGGKSDALCIGALRYIHLPQYRALLLRRTFPELERSLIERARQWYPIVGGKSSDQGKAWRFPSGAVVEFGHLEHDDDVYKYFSAEYQNISFDELTTFTENQYRKMLSRLRSSHGIPVRARAGTNPGGDGHEWVMGYWEPWLRADDPEYKGTRAASGEVLWYVNDPETEQIEWVPRGTPGALSRVFQGAKVDDNPHLMEGDPSYVTRLSGLDRVTRAQLRDGNWLARPGRGAFFKRAWFEFVDVAPAEVLARTRHWDFAASVEGFDKKGKPTDPDWTAGLKLSITVAGVWYVEHVHRFRGRPGEVKDTVKSFAATDGQRCRISIPQDPGQAGVAQVEDYIRSLAGTIIHARKETGEKVDRAKPVSAQAEARNIRIVKGPWNEAFLQELEAFPEGKKDQVDAFSGAFTDLIEGGYVTLGTAPTLSGTRRADLGSPGDVDDDDEEEHRSWRR